jgi:hypothetical protein
VAAVGRRSRGVVTAHDVGRLRLAWTIVAVGTALGAVGAAWTAIAGASGAAGLAMLLLGAALGSAAAALASAVLALVDEVRGRPVARRRIGIAVGLFATTLLLLVLLAGVVAT